MRTLGRATAMLAFLAPASLEAQNTASQLEIQNCGGYAVVRIALQTKTGDHWQNVFCWGDQCSSSARGLSDTEPKKGRLNSGQALCYDMSRGERWGSLYRLRMTIASGDTKKSNETRIDPGANKRRVFRMKGTTRNNNRPRSRGYKNTAGSGKCGSQGTKSQVNCTPISALDAPAIEHLGRRSFLAPQAVNGRSRR